MGKLEHGKAAARNPATDPCARMEASAAEYDQRRVLVCRSRPASRSAQRQQVVAQSVRSIPQAGKLQTPAAEQDAHRRSIPAQGSPAVRHVGEDVGRSIPGRGSDEDGVPANDVDRSISALAEQMRGIGCCLRGRSIDPARGKLLALSRSARRSVIDPARGKLADDHRHQQDPVRSIPTSGESPGANSTGYWPVDRSLHGEPRQQPQRDLRRRSAPGEERIEAVPQPLQVVRPIPHAGKACRLQAPAGS